MAQQRHTFTPWFFIALVLSNHGIAMAARIEMNQKARTLGQGMGPNQEIENAHDTYRRMSCGELEVVMEQVTNEAVTWLQGTSSFSEMNAEQIQGVSLFTIQISSIADVADMKLCLPEVLNFGQVAEHLEQFSSLEERFASSATSEEARERFQRAFSRVGAFQTDLANIQGHVLNRHVLLPDNVEDPAVCPSPCTTCTREHNSWFQESSDFSFKCIMDAGASVPTGEGFTCEEPTPRRSNSNQQKSWCQVHDWEAAAAQTTEISAAAACGARSILAPLQHGGNMSDMAVAACEKELTGESLTQEEINELRRLDSEIDEVVSPGNLATFSLCLIIEVVTAVSELRLRSRTQNSQSSLIQAEQPAHDHAIAYTQGSWRCMRGIISLANGLFGAMIEIVIGVAYLAIMGSLGLLAAMSVFGADAVVATLAPHAGLSVATMGEALGGATAAVSTRIADFLLNRRVVQESLQNAAEAGATAAGAADAAVVVTADAAAASVHAVAAQEAQALATTIETLGGFGDQIMVYWPAVAGGLTILSVGFGIWGLARIWHSFDNPHDCRSGYARVNGHAVCHPAMRFGEAHHADCPGFEQPNVTGVDHHGLAFVCSSSNGGITTFNSGQCQADTVPP